MARDKVEIILNGKVIRQSQNLRGLLDHGRRYGVENVSVWRGEKGSGGYFVQFGDGAFSRGAFASFAVCRDWFRSRRSWELTAVRCSDDVWRFFRSCANPPLERVKPALARTDK